MNGLEFHATLIQMLIYPDFIQSYSDEEGNTIRAPFSGTWPLEVINHLMLTESEGKTTLTLRGGPFNATEEERTTFESMRPHVQQGFVGTFDQLDASLEQNLNR
ncbi:SRPBCC domain-containing protein [Paenibacillus glucanolyticus]|nr:SRPBCC domain-containing protein [Paenibacillus glucanolyticus]